MNSIEKLLKGANVYSIEYAGFYNIKFSINYESIVFNIFDNLIFEFVEGCILYNEHNNIVSTEMYILKLFGLNVIKIETKEYNQVRFTFENNYSIETILNKEELFDRSWILHSLDFNSYILNDHGEIFISEDFNNILGIGNASDSVFRYK